MPLLPDLDQVAPSAIAARTGANGRTRLIFDAAVENHGAGTLALEGRRPGRGQPEMRADQIVQMDDGSAVRRPGVGRLRYVVSPDHRHWHLLRFMSFELTPVDGQQAPRRDRKTGFCLGDRYPAQPPGSRTAPRYTGGCGLRRPDLLSVREGITPGHGDDYAANLEGQFIDITGLPTGRYVLVHRSDPDALLQETTRDDNASSALIRIAWRARTARVVVLRTCPDSERCAPRASSTTTDTAHLAWADALESARAECALPPRTATR